MPPVEFVGLAADLDCQYIGIGLESKRYYNPHGYEDWSFRNSPALRRETLAALRHHNVSISLFEGFGVRSGCNVRELASDLDIVRELGGRRINAVSIDKDFHRTLDQFAILAEMGAARGIDTVIEIGGGVISNLAAALDVAHHVRQPYFKLLLDTMHYFRLCGGSIAELTRIDTNLLGYIQLCDAPLAPLFSSYREEALHERLIPGDGKLPLNDVLGLVPPDVVVSVEIPQRSLAEAGIPPLERVRRSVQATRHLLARQQS
jgi:sugar phosphate isomerase/epimerase